MHAHLARFPTPFRGLITQLGFDYGAHVRIVALCTPLPALFARNKKRPHPVPDSVLQRQLETFQWPSVEEAHEISELLVYLVPLPRVCLEGKEASKNITYAGKQPSRDVMTACWERSELECQRRSA